MWADLLYRQSNTTDMYPGAFWITSMRKKSLRSIQAGDIETYILQAGKRLSRASLQQEIAARRLGGADGGRP